MIGWFDGGAGASGDMLLGALVGAGVPVAVPQSAIDALDLGITLRVREVQRGGLAATKVDVEVPETKTVRHLRDVLAMFDPLDPEVARIASEVFGRLAEAEAAVHNMAIDEVHFHEVGALDSIADVVGAAAGLAHLKLETISCSMLSLGNGATRGAHGPLPIPVPAVVELLCGGVPVQAGPAQYESTTPTGAAILVTMVDCWEPMPAMSMSHIGLGAGTKDTSDAANALRLIIGECLATND